MPRKFTHKQVVVDKPKEEYILVVAPKLSTNVEAYTSLSSLEKALKSLVIDPEEEEILIFKGHKLDINNTAPAGTVDILLSDGGKLNLPSSLVPLIS